jgi:hypothetical protein
MTSNATGLWDTGASGSVITQSVIDQLAIQPITMALVHGVHGPAFSPVYLVDLLLPMGVVMPGLNVTRGDIFGADVLIGMDVIRQGDFAITNQGGKTKMTFRVPSLADLDFVKTVQDQGRSRKARRPKNEGQRAHAPDEEKWNRAHLLGAALIPRQHLRWWMSMGTMVPIDKSDLEVSCPHGGNRRDKTCSQWVGQCHAGEGIQLHHQD